MLVDVTHKGVLVCLSIMFSLFVASVFAFLSVSKKEAVSGCSRWTRL